MPPLSPRIRPCRIVIHSGQLSRTSRACSAFRVPDVFAPDKVGWSPRTLHPCLFAHLYPLYTLTAILLEQYILVCDCCQSFMVLTNLFAQHPARGKAISRVFPIRRVTLSPEVSGAASSSIRRQRDHYTTSQPPTRLGERFTTLLRREESI